MTEQKLTIGPTLTVRRTFPSSRLKIFRAWTTPQALEKWFKPFGMSITVAYLELRVGGSFRFDYLESDACTSSVTGTYLEIVEPQKLSFTWSSPSLDHNETVVTIRFEERENGTEMILTQSGFLQDELVGKHVQGWQSAFEVLDRVLASE
ncbi:MAG TPA: SRPBCC domain-containing protein [Chloroflexia bacterium]|nr:SRPBCC domain-containing protein [Chloroflexia bacterium]